ncbi:YybH family protein [Nocardia sp. NPDC050406]|uniref:YybH family protein n=1 Tax=Nocardia sp. NPDC050406 TaxID=3364318 RepID=UPI0037B7F469
MTANEDEIRAFLARRTEAQRAKDIDRLMACYSPDIVYYDVVAPLRFTGADEVRRNFLRWFDGYTGPIGLETHDLTIGVEGDVAFANMLHLDSGTHIGGVELSMWVRETVCLRRVDGRWLVTHEHISMPVSPTNFQVWCAKSKDAPARGGGSTVFGLVLRGLRARVTRRR